MLNLLSPLTWVPHPSPVLRRVGLLNFGFDFEDAAAGARSYKGNSIGDSEGKSVKHACAGGRHATRTRRRGAAFLACGTRTINSNAAW
jgi:hypothetical protein